VKIKIQRNKYGNTVKQEMQPSDSKTSATMRIASEVTCLQVRTHVSKV